jgi:glycyl-tRNA synthetase beta chain
LELLFEIGTEELPPSFVRPALRDIETTVSRHLEKAGIGLSSVRTFGTPRRLVLALDGLADKAEDRKETIFGPPAGAAYDDSGKPTRAAIGFAKSHGVSVGGLKRAEKGKGEYVCIEKTEEGRLTIDQVPEMLSAILSGISFPKTMRWEPEGRRFARPIRWMVLVADGRLCVDSGGNRFSWAGIEVGTATQGHRFLGSREIEVESVDQYITELRANFVIVDHEERKNLIRRRTEDAAASASGMLVADDDLLERVTFTVEYPLAVVGSFSPAFLEMPREVVVTALKEHQDFFSVVDGDGNLMPHFVAVGNTDRDRSGKIKRGNERVLNARLDDAHFYWKEDLKVGLDEMAGRLCDVVWQEQLGSLGEKAERVKKLARIVGDMAGLGDAARIDRAASLTKADLTSFMVREKEFSGLQGVMGREYAKALGEDAEVADAIFEHYLPRFAGDVLPETPTGTVLALADKLDTVVGCFGIGLIPTGSEDPYALRRQAMGIVRILVEKDIAMDLEAAVRQSIELYPDRLSTEETKLQGDVLFFVWERLRKVLADMGYTSNMIEAVVRGGLWDPAQKRNKLEAIREFQADPRFSLFVRAFKRALNITLGHDREDVDESLFTEDAEGELYRVFQSIGPRFSHLTGNRRYREALELLLEFAGPIDVFFDKVMVMVDNERIRNNRLSLLAAVASLFWWFADFSTMEESR